MNIQQALSPEKLQERLGYYLSKPQLIMDYWWYLSRFMYILSGKRVGKSGWIAYKLIEQSYNKDHIYWIVCRSFDLVDRVWADVEKHARKLGFDIVESKGYGRRITNPETGSIIEAKSTKHGWEHLRGVPVDGVVIDEATLMQKEAYDNDIEPNLMTTGGWCVLITNAPRSSANWFMTKYEKGIKFLKEWKAGGRQGKLDHVSLHFTSYDSPFIPKEELDKKRDELLAEGKEDIWNTQYMAKPPSLKGEVFSSGIDDCIVPDTFIPGRYEKGRYIAAFDPARKRDKPVLCIWDKQEHTAMKFYEMERMPAPDVEAAVIAKIKMWNVSKLVVDDTGGGFYLVDHFRRTFKDKNMDIICIGLSFSGGQKRKKKKNMIIEALKQRIENWSIRFIRDPELLRQLESFIITETDGGSVKYTAPKGDYDDFVDVLGIANWEDIVYPYNESVKQTKASRNRASNTSIIYS